MSSGASGGGSTVSSSAAVHVFLETRGGSCLLADLVSM